MNRKEFLNISPVAKNREENVNDHRNWNMIRILKGTSLLFNIEWRKLTVYIIYQKHDTVKKNYKFF